MHPWSPDALDALANEPGADQRTVKAKVSLGAATAKTKQRSADMKRTIHVVPGAHQDWIVKEEGGRELGHYPSKESAKEVGQKLARMRSVELLIHDDNGKVQKRSRPSKGWFARIFER